MSQIIASTWFVSCVGKACHRAIKEAKKMNGCKYAYLVDKKLSSGKADVVIDMELESEEKLKENRAKIGLIPGVTEIICNMSKQTLN